MLSEGSLETILKAIKFKYDEHIGKLLSIPSRHLNKIAPNKGLPISKILKGFNADTGGEIRGYGESLRVEITRVLEKLNLSEFTEEDKNSIMAFVESHCQAELYKKRFDLMLDAIDRTVRRYGLKFERDKHYIDIPKSICEVDAENTTRKIKANIENELDCLVESFQSRVMGSNSRVSDASKFLELKPNFMGIGVNLNAILEKVFHRKKHKMSPMLITIIGGVIVLIIGAFLIEPIKTALLGNELPSVKISNEIQNTAKKSKMEQSKTKIDDNNIESIESIRKTFLLQSSSSIKAYGGHITVTLNSSVEYVNQPITLTISIKGKPSQRFENIALGKKVFYEGYEITFENLQRNVNIYDVLLNIEKI